MPVHLVHKTVRIAIIGDPSIGHVNTVFRRDRQNIFNAMLDDREYDFRVATAQAALGEDNVGAILPPEISADARITNSLIGGPGQSMVVSKNSKNPEMAVKLLSFLNSKDEVLKFSQTQTVVPVRKDLTAADLGFKPGSIAAKMFEWGQHYTFWVDNELSGPVVDDFNKLLPLVLTGKMSPEDFTKQLDKDKPQQ